MKAFLIGVALMCSASAAEAQDWSSYFNMGTFAAAGGSDENGWLSFECAGEDSGFSTAGQPHVTLRLIKGVTVNKRQVQREMTYWLGDDTTLDVPLRLAPGSVDELIYEYDPQTVGKIIDFIGALRRGKHFAAMTIDGHVATIALDGSHAALEFVESCVVDAH